MYQKLYTLTMKSRFTAYLLWLFGGVVGAHKFYLGRPGMGLLYLFTGGLCGIGWLVDFFTLGNQVDVANAVNHAQSSHLSGPWWDEFRPAAIKNRTKLEDLYGLSPEKQIIRISEDERMLDVRQVVARTNLDIEEAEEALGRLVDRGIAKLCVSADGKASYDFG
jgi:TM2 domain-containing membrane protein YozV